MKAKSVPVNIARFALSSLIFLQWPLTLCASPAGSEDNRESNERNLYDENRARVDLQIWHDEHQFRPPYWSEDDYFYIPQNERDRYQPIRQRAPQSSPYRSNSSNYVPNYAPNYYYSPQDSQNYYRSSSSQSNYQSHGGSDRVYSPPR